ncbi:MAG: type II toxin-antitoxin system PemK/MazF family toxin [Acidobacteriota bacterium]|nr:type II toxin-antitoxin system PemK/MazF family toxin [Acidobacteriota bacterium]
MVIPANGAVILVRFPFSDLSGAKLRPAIALADTGRGDWILCQVTSQPYTDSQAVEIANNDLASGSFRKNSFARPGKLFTANAAIMTKQIGELKSEKLEEIIRAIISMLEKSIV